MIFLLLPLLLAVAQADPAVVEPSEPTAVQAAAQPQPQPQPQLPELTPEQRAALANRELLENLDLLQDLDVARYLDLLRMEED